MNRISVDPDRLAVSTNTGRELLSELFSIGAVCHVSDSLSSPKKVGVSKSEASQKANRQWIVNAISDDFPVGSTHISRRPSMGDTVSWIAGQFASLVPNMLPAATAAASSSGGSGCGVLVSIRSDCNDHVECKLNKAKAEKVLVFVSNCGAAVPIVDPSGCCSVCC
jgi:hypothetical protein